MATIKRRRNVSYTLHENHAVAMMIIMIVMKQIYTTDVDRQQPQEKRNDTVGGWHKSSVSNIEMRMPNSLVQSCVSMCSSLH